MYNIVPVVEQCTRFAPDGADLQVAAAARQSGGSQLLVHPARAAYARPAHAARLRLLPRQTVSAIQLIAINPKKYHKQPFWEYRQPSVVTDSLLGENFREK